MKKGRGKLLVGIILINALLLGCIKLDDFEIPISEWKDSEIESNSSLRALTAAVEQTESHEISFGENDPTVVSGYVISSDEAGGFYKTLLIQDQPENASIGIQIKLDMKAYYGKFRIGRKLLVRLAGLTAVKEKEIYVLGYLLRDQLAPIPNGMIDRKIIRSSEIYDVVGKGLKIEEISKSDLNTFVSIKGLQFSYDDLGLTYAGEIYDRYIGDRVLENCHSSSKISLQTSVYSDFRSMILPEGRFDLEAIVTQDIYSGDIILSIIDPGYIKENEDDRCDPVFYECLSEEEPGQRIIFYEDFDDLSSTRDLNSKGWYNINLNFGNGKFKKRSRNENVFLQISAYDTGENNMEVWLISPPINLDSSEKEVLSFRSRSTFEKGKILKVWISDNFEGDVKGARWQQLDVNISRGSIDGSNEEFLNSGEIQLDCIKGDLHLAFQYLGSDPVRTTTYDLDHVLILGNR